MNIIYPASYGCLLVLGTMYMVQVWKGRKHAYRTLQRCYIEGNRGREFYRAGLNITLCGWDLMGGCLHTLTYPSILSSNSMTRTFTAHYLTIKNYVQLHDTTGTMYTIYLSLIFISNYMILGSVWGGVRGDLRVVSAMVLCDLMQHLKQYKQFVIFAQHITHITGTHTRHIDRL